MTPSGLRIASAATATPASALCARRGGGAVPRLVIVAALCLGLMGCGFHPLYGNARLSPQMASIYVGPIAENTGYELRNRLIDLFRSNGDAAGKNYTLKITLTSSNQGVALQNDATITRYNDTLRAAYVLIDAKGATVTQGNLSGLSSYNVANSPFATVAAQQDSDLRAADDLAERIQLDLGVFFSRRDTR
jgi:LPS-assembly lipoprotein